MLDFLGIGAQKSGTTWLYEQLRQHHQIAFPAGKEVHFWDLYRDRGLDWWLGLFEKMPPGMLAGEITPAYAMLDRQTIEEINKLFPDLRVFYCIRNPIERAWSGAKHELRLQKKDASATPDSWFIEQFDDYGNRERSRYKSAIARWRGIFGGDRFHLMFFDEIKQQPERLLINLFQFLGIDPQSLTFNSESLRLPVNKGLDIPIRPGFLEYLQQIYIPEIRGLEEFLNCDLSHWRDCREIEIDTIRQRKQVIINQYGEWTNHNIRLKSNLYTISDQPTGADIKLRRYMQIIIDHLNGQPFEQIRVLDLACLEGLYGIEMALQGAKVVAIEGRTANIAKARFAKEVLGLENLELIQDDVRNLSKEKYGKFDIVLCLGILYHLDVPDGFHLIEKVADVCDKFAIIDTHLSVCPEKSVFYDGNEYWGNEYVEHSREATNSEKAQSLWASLDNPISFWLTLPSLHQLLSKVGFTSIYECHHPPVPKYEILRAKEGVDRATFLAMKGQSAVNILSSPLTNNLSSPDWAEIEQMYAAATNSHPV